MDGAATDETDCGMEWPEFENTDVARYRRFYQVRVYVFVAHLSK